MENLPLILLLSILFQSLAAAMALFLIPVSRKALAWFLLSAAFILMTLRRIITLLSQKEIVGDHWQQLVHPEWVALIISILMLVGVIHIRGIFLHRNRMEDALRESEERYALAAQGSNDGLWDWNLKTNQVYYSGRWKAMLGYADFEISDSPDEAKQRIHQDDRARVDQAIEDHIAGRTPHFEEEHRIRHKDGHYLWVLNRGMVIRDDAGIATRIAGSQSDITDRKKVEQQLLHNALHDKLTGLANRALFLERLGKAVKRTQQDSSYIFAVLFLDLDRFKVLNDSRGHTIGDQMLLTVAKRIESCMRADDMVARLGGDEFAVLLEPIADMQQLEIIAGRIQDAISLPMTLNGQTVFTTASIGMAPSTYGYELPEHILRDADTAMYHAKELGKARQQMFNPNMHIRAVELMQLETDLRHAIQNDEFVVHYQPIVAVSSEALVGLEALVRWQHPEAGLVSPLDFIPLAEETGLIIPIGKQVLRKACQQMTDWRNAGLPLDDIGINVNISSRQFFDPDFIKDVADILCESALEPHYLRMEMTESVLMEDVTLASSLFNRIKAMGINLHMDDFGTGYSSLSYLHRFPVDGLKIDRSFVSQMDAGENEEIVTTIIDLAHGLNMVATAEGVETREQLERLRALGCEYAQGYYFSRPTDSEGIKQFLSSNKPASHSAAAG